MRVTRVRVPASVLAALTCLGAGGGCGGEIARGISQETGGSAGSESSGGRAGGAGHAGSTGNAGSAGTGAVSATGGAGGTSEASGTGGASVGGGEPQGGIGGLETGGEGGESGSPDPCGELTHCGESCVVLAADSLHCGECERSCLSDAHTTELECLSGVCNQVCAPGFGDCTHPSAPVADDGCETNLASPSSCGTTCENQRACSEDEVCDNGCQAHGLVKITVPFTTSGQNQRYADSHPPDHHVDQIVTIRLYAPGATAGTIHIYAIDGDSSSGPGTTRNLSSFASGWVDVQLALGDVKDSFDPGNFRQVTFDIQSNSTSTWDAPVVIYIDHVTVSGAQGWKDLFTEPATLPLVKSTLASVDGSKLEWVEFLP